MKIFVDENIPFMTVQELLTLGHDVMDIRGTCTACPLREKCTTSVKLGRAITRDGYEEYRERMKEKLSTSEGRSIYGKRKCLVEPVFGQMKTRGGFSQFLLRGLRKVRLEWKIAAIAHNLLKITAAIIRK